MTQASGLTAPKAPWSANTDRRAPLRDALKRSGQFGPEQTAGRFYPIGCVALEVTQRCNLDCSLCYLSDTAEMAHDVPLPILLRRIDQIGRHYGPATSIQITGGDPTLRKAADLSALCRHIRARGMRSCLMTNGIKATRNLLKYLAAAGLDDVAFHVDTTQERKGYPIETALNAVRKEYLSRARGLGLRIMFNTTVFEGNFRELPDLARFFRVHSRDITVISFQLQADTGRGVLRERPESVTQESVMDALSAGMGLPLDFETAAIGHYGCNRYASILTAGAAGEEVASAFGDRRTFQDLLAGLEDHEQNHEPYLDKGRTLRRLALHRPRLTIRAAGEALKLAWKLRRGLWSGRGRINRMGVLVHNFMAADRLETDRCESCVFMVATEHGPLSMCVHNAERDLHVNAPARLETPNGLRWWHAGTGEASREPRPVQVGPMPLKRMKGRLRRAASDM